MDFSYSLDADAENEYDSDYDYPSRQLANARPAIAKMVDSNPSRRAAAERARAAAAGESPPETTPKARKKRTNLTDADFLILFKHCNRLRDEFRPGSKMQFWTDVQSGLANETGKHIMQPKFPIEKKAEDRRRFLQDPNVAREVWYDNELSATVDIFNEWMDAYLEENPESNNGLPRRSESRRSDTRPSESRILPPPFAFGRTPTPASGNMRPPSSTANNNQHSSAYVTPYGPPPSNKRAREEDDAAGFYDDVLGFNDTSGARSGAAPASKRLRQSDPEVPQRVIVEGALSKQDWIEIMGHNTRLTALEEKVNTILETTKRTHQMLLQLAKNNQAKKGGGAATGLNDTAQGSSLTNGSQATSNFLNDVALAPSNPG